ncbi:MFS transporter [Pseudarthrobacter sp. H3Y2-7]|uniref:MFS transporter n=1 Tax=Pseudarthrobacter naphthalenicus TaxID=3031328 RepID=UPI0023AF7172|nr:MFS transporter [Pseudarthrobacter sp. H3Y2-7]MDE8666995.1 MFS transporter [Pseudarthrobacter sp. H3Y2-7]
MTAPPAPPALSAAPPKTRTAVVLGVVALVLIGLNLRAGISGASALLHDLQQVLGYGPLLAAVIPSVPTLCFALAGAATSWLTGRLGVEKAILLALAFLAGGLLLRGIPSTGMLLAGTVIGMSGLAVCNVAMPSFIREHFAHRTSTMTMLYTVTMTIGATASAVAVIPLAQALGSPSSAVGAIGFLAVAAFLGFLPVVLHTHRHSVRKASTHISPWPLLRTRKGLLLTAIFTLQALLAYSLISWFPSMLITMGVAAAESGLLYGLMQLVSVPAGMLVIAIGSRPRMLRPALYLASTVMLAGLASLLWLPVSPAVIPAVLLGVGLGIFPLVMVMISRSGTSTAETTALSTLAQSIGYLLATAGPFGTGLLYGITGSWTLPVALLLSLAVVQVAVAHLISRAPLAGRKSRTP